MTVFFVFSIILFAEHSAPKYSIIANPYSHQICIFILIICADHIL